jgi:GNAT superfamily N-acetyltransferase
MQGDAGKRMSENDPLRQESRTVQVRSAERSELDRLATLWHDGWQDAHAGLLPAELAAARSWPSFRDRLEAALADLRVAGEPGSPLGFYLLKGDELYQFYVAAAARGTGLAATLIADAERQLATAGVRVAWLACAIGNARAARFYEKCGWRLAGNVILPHEVPNGVLQLEVWRYEKALAR